MTLQKEELDKLAEEMKDLLIHEEILEVLIKAYELGFKAGRRYGDIDFLGK